METLRLPVFGKETILISPQDALKTILQKTRPLGMQSIPLAQASGYCLASDIRADRDLPPTHRSAMDGYALRRTLRAALRSRDIVLLSGGVSVGRYDLVPQIIKEMGAKIQFHKVAIKPGKPLLYATSGRNQHIFGLPGNPLSALNGFHEFVLPALRRLSGYAVQDCRPSNRLPLAETVTPRGKRMEHILVKVVQSETGPHAAPVLSRGSADLLGAAQADGVVILPRDKQKCQAGCYVEFRSWRPLS